MLGFSAVGMGKTTLHGSRMLQNLPEYQQSQRYGKQHTSSVKGRTRGAREAMLVFSAVAAVGTTLRCSRMPRMPSSSSRWRMALKASSSAPMWLRTLCISWYLATLRSAGLRTEIYPAQARRNAICLTTVLTESSLHQNWTMLPEACTTASQALIHEEGHCLACNSSCSPCTFNRKTWRRCSLHAEMLTANLISGWQSPVGHEAGSASNAEQAVGDEAGAVVARVIVVGDVLVRHNQHALVGHGLRSALRISASL